MKRTTFKLVGVLCISLFVAFAAIIVVFHIAMDHYIKSNAYGAIKYELAIDYTQNTGQDVDENLTTMATWLLLQNNYTLFPDDTSTAVKRGIANWCEANPNTDNTISYAEINGRHYYISQNKLVGAIDGLDGVGVLYVDVTSEINIINYIDMSMLIIMLVCSASACFAGVRIGIDIERRQERQKKFFENASHELKTPLMSIQGYAEGIWDGVIKDQKQAIKVIMDETDKMALLVDEILCLSRIESGAVKLNKETVSVADIINDCLVSLELSIHKKEIEVELHIAQGTIEADVLQFEKAVMNVLSNAVKYAEKHIVIAYHHKQLSVWNDGMELSNEDLAHIFDRFYIGKNGNTGIGLSLTKEIVVRHGWNIKVANINDGTQFMINF